MQASYHDVEGTVTWQATKTWLLQLPVNSRHGPPGAPNNGTRGDSGGGDEPPSAPEIPEKSRQERGFGDFGPAPLGLARGGRGLDGAVSFL